MPSPLDFLKEIITQRLLPSVFNLFNDNWLHTMSQAFAWLLQPFVHLSLTLLKSRLSQVQILAIFVALYLHRKQPAWLVRKERILLPAKWLLLSLLPQDPNEDASIITNTDMFDLVLATTLLIRLCLPQTTAFFVASCRPLTSPLPQCQDLHYPLITYVVTFWINVGLVVLIEAGKRSIGCQQASLSMWSHQRTNIVVNNLVWRLVFILWALYEAYRGPSTRFPGSGDVLFSPKHFGCRVSGVTLVSCSAFYIISALGDHLNFVSALSKFWSDPAVTPCVQIDIERIVDSNYCTPFNSLKKRSSENVSNRRKPRRPPLTLQTFISPLCEYNPPNDVFGPIRGESDVLLECFRTPKSLGKYQTFEVIHNSHFEYSAFQSSGLESREGFTRSLNAIEKAGWSTPPPQEILTQENDDEDGELRFRPGSRLGFRPDEIHPRYANSRIIDDDIEMDGCAVGLYRRVLRAASPSKSPLAISTSITLDQATEMALPLTPISNGAVSPCSSPRKTSTRLSLSPVSIDDASSSDSGERQVMFSHRAVRGGLYDWEKAASFLSELSTLEETLEDTEEIIIQDTKVGLIRVPSLATIHECGEEDPSVDIEQ